MIEPVKRMNVTDSIVNQIKDLVLQGKLNEGDKLPPERELMNLFGVGRPSLREALKVLEAQGLIEKTQKGTIITGNHDKFFSDSLMFQLYFSSADWQDIFEARRFLEKELTYLATTRANSEDFNEIEQTIVDMELSVRENNQTEYVRSNLEFHKKIAKASKNLVLFNLYESINNLVKHSQESGVTVYGVMNESLNYHKAIFKAMKERNAERASDLMVQHINSVEGYFQKSQN
ncbi:FadR/GntR family transcriptional regulator [Fredinandcohnia onubensis]|uniref:FadR/GntR family transcriptional regulator n=1 Tax=Fredinandcohnia onubensis TaxID=1571209 RepID=UPI000C0C0A5D|nr:FadR/GntR family transcriptional regulator [Fredinandcohnia onubensis]